MSSPPKGKRKALSQKERQAVWNKWISQSKGEGPCWVGCGGIIYQSAFEAGHVISVAENGNNHISNLRPICGSCNKAMGTQHMFDYMREHGLVSPYVNIYKSSPYDDLVSYSVWWKEIRMGRAIFQCDLGILIHIVNFMPLGKCTTECTNEERDRVLLLYYVLKTDGVYIVDGIPSWNLLCRQYHGGLLPANHPVICDIHYVTSYNDISQSQPAAASSNDP